MAVMTRRSFPSKLSQQIIAFIPYVLAMIIDPRRSLSTVDLSNKLLSWPSIPYLPSIKGQRLLHSLCIGADFVRVPNLGFVFMIGGQRRSCWFLFNVAREWICGRLRPMIVPIAILLGEFGWWSLSDDPDLPGTTSRSILFFFLLLFLVLRPDLFSWFGTTS